MWDGRLLLVSSDFSDTIHWFDSTNLHRIKNMGRNDWAGRLQKTAPIGKLAASNNVERLRGRSVLQQQS